MIVVYRATGRGLERAELGLDQPVPPEAVWVDLVEPTRAEEVLVERSLGVDLPTREEMQEIELSSRLYEAAGRLFMTVPVMVKSDTTTPETAPVTFVLCDGRLVTLRYADPRSIAAYAARARQLGAEAGHGTQVFLGLVEAIVDRAADVLERIGAEVDAISAVVFAAPPARPGKGQDFQEVLRRIGRTGDLGSKARESLVGLGRVAAFASQHVERGRIAGAPGDAAQRLHSIGQDVHALTDHATYLSGKINFLLDATLGMINIEQNAIIKIFSVAAVMFLPPTLIASLYGMNFEFMPELHWHWGYPLVLLAMLVSAIVPYLFFRRRGWL